MFMKLKKNSKGRIILSCQLFALCLILCAGILFFGMLYPENANSGPYLNSAHGNSTYGVNRTSLSTFGYSQGNCVHCHEQHASIGGAEPNPTGGPDKYALFSNSFNTSKTIKPYLQSDSICFYCHIGTGTYQTSAFFNYSYSYTFGGCSSTDCPTANIFDAFNGLSYHNLYDIWRLVTGLYGTKTFTNFPADIIHVLAAIISISHKEAVANLLVLSTALNQLYQNRAITVICGEMILLKE